MQSVLRVILNRASSLRGKLTGHASRLTQAPPARALEWIRNNRLESGGIRVHHSHRNAYPEVSGYLVPTLLEAGETRLAQELVEWLLCIQLADGSFTDPTRGVPHVFDTAQVLRGLLAAGHRNPVAAEAARRAADFLCASMSDDGREGFGRQYQGDIPESVLLYALPPLVQAAEQLGHPAYREAALRCMQYYLNQPTTLDINALTHFLAYEIEALIQLGDLDRARCMMDQVKRHQQPDGSVRGQGGVSWVCSTGLAQLAICWFRLGQWEPAERAMAWLDAHQESSGGFFGSYGPDATYFPTQQIGWAVKFYLDAHQLRRKAYLVRNTRPLPPTETLYALTGLIPSGSSVLHWGAQDVSIRHTFPTASLALLSGSPSPEGDGMILGATLENLAIDAPFTLKDVHEAGFEHVLEINVLPFVIDLDATVTRMAELTRDGGWLYCLEEAAPQSRILPGWAKAPDDLVLCSALNRYCDNVSRKILPGNYVLWRGQKRSRLSGSEWNDVLINEDSRKAVLENLRANRTTAWGREMLLNTRVGDRVLEIGSGTGEISLQLARTGRRVTVLDISEESLEFTHQCAQDLDVEIDAACADAMQPLPFADDTFDCVWNSGLLEHFYPSDRQAMLREWSRVTSGTLITLVPNGACLSYRAGKAVLEKSGKWRYGLEMSLLTLRDEYEAAGLHVLREYSIGVAHGLNFLPKGSPLRRALANWLAGSLPEDTANQGYLLITIGRKRSC